MSPSFFNAIRYIESNSHETVTYLEALAADTLKMNEAEKNALCYVFDLCF